MSPPDRLPARIDRLEARYGKPDPPPAEGPWSMIVWEHVVYLASDDLRLQAFNALRSQVGLSPRAILRAPRNKLAGMARGRGILAENCAEKLKDAAEAAVEAWGGISRGF